MSEIPVSFERIHGPGLQTSLIRINSTVLDFDNHKATFDLNLGEEFEIYWEITGEPDSTLTVKYTVEDVTKTAVDGSKIPSGQSRYYDYKYIAL